MTDRGTVTREVKAGWAADGWRGGKRKTAGAGNRGERGTAGSGLGQPDGGCREGQTAGGGADRRSDQAGRAADSAACAATEDWLRTTRQREIPEKGRNIEI